MVSDPRAKFISWYHDLDFKHEFIPKLLGSSPKTASALAAAATSAAWHWQEASRVRAVEMVERKSFMFIAPLF